jgi:hypothetical protein
LLVRHLRLEDVAELANAVPDGIQAAAHRAGLAAAEEAAGIREAGVHPEPVR